MANASNQADKPHPPDPPPHSVIDQPSSLIAIQQREEITAIATELLVSVRSEQEIDDALAADVTIVDLKEPRHGPLAPASRGLWRYAAARWRAMSGPTLPTGAQSPNSHSPKSQSTNLQRPKLSAALGESRDAIRLAGSLPEQFHFAKAGPSRCDSVEKLWSLWNRVRADLDPNIELVAVAYADSDQARCLPPALIFRAAIEAGIQRCLIDTWVKDGRSTIDHLGTVGLRQLDQIARGSSLWWAVAGSLRSQDVAPLSDAGLQPNCYGVRGDVCDGDRTSRLSADRIAAWKTATQVTPPSPKRSS